MNVLITGANRGLGLQLAKEFEKAGHKVFVTGRDLEKLKTSLNEAGINNDCCYQLDISESDSIRNFFHNFKKFNEMDRVIHCASLYGNSLKESSEKDYVSWGNAYEFALNLAGVCVNSLKPGSRVVFVGSIAGKIGKISANFAPYGIYKEALRLISEGLDKEGAERDIRSIYINLGSFRDKETEGCILTEDVIRAIISATDEKSPMLAGQIDLMSAKESENYIW